MPIIYQPVPVHVPNQTVMKLTAARRQIMVLNKQVEFTFFISKHEMKQNVRFKCAGRGSVPLYKIYETLVSHPAREKTPQIMGLYNYELDI